MSPRRRTCMASSCRSSPGTVSGRLGTSSYTPPSTRLFWMCCRNSTCPGCPCRTRSRRTLASARTPRRRSPVEHVCLIISSLRRENERARARARNIFHISSTRADEPTQQIRASNSNAEVIEVRSKKREMFGASKRFASLQTAFAGCRSRSRSRDTSMIHPVDRKLL